MYSVKTELLSVCQLQTSKWYQKTRYYKRSISGQPAEPKRTGSQRDAASETGWVPATNRDGAEGAHRINKRSTRFPPDDRRRGRRRHRAVQTAGGGYRGPARHLADNQDRRTSRAIQSGVTTTTPTAYYNTRLPPLHAFVDGR